MSMCSDDFPLKSNFLLAFGSSLLRALNKISLNFTLRHPKRRRLLLGLHLFVLMPSDMQLYVVKTTNIPWLSAVSAVFRDQDTGRKKSVVLVPWLECQFVCASNDFISKRTP